MNADRQPDGWRRRKDRSHPAYIAAEIVSRDEKMAAQGRNLQNLIVRAYQAWKTGRWDNEYVPETIPPFLVKLFDGVVIQNCYEIRMDGGAFELVSPKFQIDPHLSYQFSAEFCTQNLDSHSAFLELRILNSNGQVVNAFRSPHISGSTDWRQLESEIFTLPSDSELHFGELHLYVQPQPNGTGKGIVRIDSIQVSELPRVSITSDQPYNVARSDSPFNVNFQVIGQSPKTDSALVEVIDIDGCVVQTKNVPIHRAPLSREYERKLVSVIGHRSAQSVREERSFNGSIHNWTNTTGMFSCNIQEPGYYTIRLKLADQAACEMPVAVLGRAPIKLGMFGWTLRHQDLALSELGFVDLLVSLGVGYVKVPVWVDHRDSETLQSLGKWMSRVSNENIVCIGTMEKPLESETTATLQGTEKLHAAAILSDSNVWYQSVEPVLTSLGMKLDWIQIGSEDDRSAAGNPGLQKNLEAIKSHVHAIGQDMSIAIGWDWHQPIAPMTETDGTHSSSWNALHLSSQQKLSADELLEQSKSWPKSNIQTWTSLAPSPMTEGSTRELILDLIQQMLAVRRSDVTAAFINPVFDNDAGLFDSQRRPSQLLLPWTYVADAISARRYFGSLDLANSSNIHFFDGEDGTVALLWSNHPTTEQLFLGDGIEAKDVWGRTVALKDVTYPSGSVATELSIGKWPILISNVDKAIVQWQQEFQLNSEQLSSQIADKGALSVTFQNTLETPVDVSISAYASSLFEDGSVRSQMQIPEKIPQQIDLGFQFLPDASAGDHLLEFAFHIQGDKDRRFSIMRQVRLGHRDLELHWQMLRLSDEFVELQVEVINNTPAPVTLDCKLFPRGTAYQRVLIVDAEVGISQHTRRVAIPKSSVSQDSPIWVRCEQVGSSLILNYRLSE